MRKIINREMMARKADIADLPAIRGLLPDLEFPRALYEKLLADPAHELLVFDAGGLAVGMAHLNFVPRIGSTIDLAVIACFVVAENLRYSGIGDELESFCETLAAGHGCDELVVHCHYPMNSAYRFFEQQGFKESRKYLTKALEPLC